jgi:hypothetical protein
VYSICNKPYTITQTTRDMQAQHSRVPMPSLCSQHLPPPASRLRFTFLLEVTGRDSFLCFGFGTNINNLYFLCPENCFPHLEIRTVSLPCIRHALCNHLATSHPGLATPLPYLAPTHPRHLHHTFYSYCFPLFTTEYVLITVL